jgi:S-adenosyl-L-methionine hydrolase (adenosine-forming)
MARPIVFMTDYGLDDEFVGVCHGVIARIAATARIIDLTHAVPRQDVVQGALTLARAARFLPADAVYLAVVDPGVGSARKAVGVATGSGATLVGPDNGLLSMAWEELGGVRRAHAISSQGVVLSPVSETFHGRDVFAPAAAHLAEGLSIEELGPRVEPGELAVVDVPRPMVARGVVGARVVGIDGFGNVQLNATPNDLEAAGLSGAVQVGSRKVPRVGTFSDVEPGSTALFVDSQGFVALAVNRGRAADLFALGRGDAVVLSPADDRGPRR